MSHLQFYRAILLRNVIMRQSFSMQLCISHTATLSHKQELTNQRSQHSHDKVVQNRALLYVARPLKSCATKLSDW